MGCCQIKQEEGNGVKYEDELPIFNFPEYSKAKQVEENNIKDNDSSDIESKSNEDKIIASKSNNKFLAEGTNKNLVKNSQTLKEQSLIEQNLLNPVIQFNSEQNRQEQLKQEQTIENKSILKKVKFETNNTPYTRSSFSNTLSNNNNFNDNTFSNGLLNKAGILTLTIKETKYNKLGQVLIINSEGLVGSLRNANDGTVYFGLYCLDVKNDFCFKAEEGMNKRHMEIKYDQGKYFVKNMYGSGVFIKILYPTPIRDNLAISFGTNHLLVNLSKVVSDQKEASVLKFKVIYGVCIGQE